MGFNGPEIRRDKELALVEFECLGVGSAQTLGLNSLDVGAHKESMFVGFKPSKGVTARVGRNEDVGTELMKKLCLLGSNSLDGL